jgi:ribonuclease J
MLQIIIHRGAHTIGGSCIEIRSGNNRIVLDLGMPLMGKGGAELDEEKLIAPSLENGILPDVVGLYKNQQPQVDAVLISHSHQDHHGLLNHIHPSIPVYLSRGSQAMIEISKVFYPEQSKIFFDNQHTFKHWESFNIGPFKVTSHLMDHSGFDASAFLIETEDKKIFYTGDFRGHGYKGKVLDNLIQNPIKDIDCLLMEGTTLGGQHSVGYASEEEVSEGLQEVFINQKDISFVTASGSNIDRIVAIYKACIRAKKTLVLDLYTYYVLEQLKPISKKLPPHKNDNIRIYYLKGHAQTIADNLDKKILYKYKSRKIETDEIVKNREDFVLKLPLSGMEKIAKELVKEKPLEHAKFIFSMWSGYLEMGDCYYDFCNKYKTTLTKVHVSGHAYLDDLKSLAGALNPKNLVPIHTLSGDDFEKYFDNVLRVEDGKFIEV